MPSLNMTDDWERFLHTSGTKFFNNYYYNSDALIASVLAVEYAMSV